MNNRRRVRWKRIKRIFELRQPVRFEDKSVDAWFHGFTVESEEADGGPSHASMAILELDDGSVELANTRDITFIDTHLVHPAMETK